MPPSTPVVDRSPIAPDKPPTMVCPACGDTMKHFRTISKPGGLPGQLLFVCPSCKGIDTREMKRVA